MNARLRELLRLGRCGSTARGLSLRVSRLPVPGAHLAAFSILGKPRRGAVEVQVEREHLRWVLDLRDDAQRLMFLNLYETELRHRVLDELPEGGTFVDVGANVGFWSIPAAYRIGSAGRVLAFEPNPWAAALLRRNIAANPSASLASIEVFETALGREPGSAELFSDDMQAGSSRATLHSGAVPTETPVHITVPVAKLDALIEGPVDVLKIDVEGHEAGVLAGAHELFAVSPPHRVVLEVHGGLLPHAGGSPEQLVTQVESLGYRAVDGDGTLGHREVPRPLPADFFETVVFARA
jgi:FkbM family methyltransferase